MIEKIKVTRQEIRCYHKEGKVQSWSYSEDFLNALLSPLGTYEISNTNANVTWYTIRKPEATLNTEENMSSPEKANVLETLKKEGYKVSEGAASMIQSGDYSIDQLKELSTDRKITVYTLNKI